MLREVATMNSLQLGFAIPAPEPTQSRSVHAVARVTGHLICMTVFAAHTLRSSRSNLGSGNSVTPGGNAVLSSPTNNMTK